MKISRAAAVSLALVLTAFLAPNALAQQGKKASTVPLNSHVYDVVVDEHDTTAFYNNGTTFCSGSNQIIDVSRFAGDAATAGPATAYGFGNPWTLAETPASTSYVHGQDCGMNCLRLELKSDSKTLNFDTRGTSGPRTMRLDFTQPCTTCPGPAGSDLVFGGVAFNTTGLLNVFLDFPFTNMVVCSSAACPEAQPAFAKFWFTDPDDPKVSWRVDWTYLRVLRMSANTWYVLADACDGTQVAGLSKLDGKRTQPRTVFSGYYKIPFFLAFVRQ